MHVKKGHRRKKRSHAQTCVLFTYSVKKIVALYFTTLLSDVKKNVLV